MMSGDLSTKKCSVGHRRSLDTAVLLRFCSEGLGSISDFLMRDVLACCRYYIVVAPFRSVSSFGLLSYSRELVCNLYCLLPIPVAARSKAWVCGRSLTGIVGSNSAGGMDVSFVSVVCCQVEVSASG